MRLSTRFTPSPIGTCQSYQLTLGFFRFMMFVAILQFGIEGNEIQAIPKVHFRERWFKRRSYRLSEGNTDDGGWGNLYVAHSGNPWGLSSAVDRHGSSQQSVPLPTRLNYVNNNVTVTKISSINETHRSIHARFRRGVTHLYNMVVCATGCSPLAYKGYGCYCGFLGSGYVMDGIDRCCKMHDWCYEATECPMFLEYFIPYYWKCYRGHKPICAIEHGDWGGSGSCAQRLCECDRSLAECLRRYPCPTTKAVCTSSPWRLIQNLFMIL